MVEDIGVFLNTNQKKFKGIKLKNRDHGWYLHSALVINENLRSMWRAKKNFRNPSVEQKRGWKAALLKQKKQER